MMMESLTLRINGAEIKQALRNMQLHQGIKLNEVRLDPGAIALELALPGHIPLHPTIYLSDPSVQGAVIALRISGRLGLGPSDILLSSIMPNLPRGINYLGRGLILLDLLEICRGAFQIIDLDGITIEPACVTLHVARAEFDLESLPKAASLLQAISIEES